MKRPRLRTMSATCVQRSLTQSQRPELKPDQKPDLNADRKRWKVGPDSIDLICVFNIIQQAIFEAVRGRRQLQL